MKQNYIWLSTYCKQLLATFIIAFTVSASFAQTYVNGNFGTSATSNNGTAAPAGTTWHELQHNTGSTTESNGVLAVGNVSFGATNNATADDFTVPPGVTWTLSSLRVYALDQVIPQTGTTSPYNNIRVRIYNGVPGAGGTIVFGDMTTNRFASTAFSGKKGIFNSLVPTPGAPSPNLPFFSIDATVSTVLTSGTYWIEWQVVHTANSFSPTSQTIGVRTMAGYNARQRIGATWATIIDGGAPASAPDVAVDLPFTLTYTASAPVACSGTPAPGNTISTAAAVCPNTPFTLSLQNTTPGTGVTYQWQSASAIGGPYTNIAGATNATLTVAAITATTFYRAIVTCAGVNGTSNPVQVTFNSAAQCGCTSSATNAFDEEIFNVSLGSLNNTSTCTTTGTGPGSVLSLYSNYTSGAGAPAAPVLLPGTTYPLSVQIGTCGGNYSSGTAVFIDYNQNGLFTDAGERVYGPATQTLGAHFATGNVTIPLSALTGVTVMRVINAEGIDGNIIAPCGTYSYGETEDYLVNIGALTACTGTPNPGNTNTTATAVCAGTPFTLSLQNNTLGSGVNYQWQSATAVGGPYTNIAGATSNSLTITVLTATTFYRAIVTCAGNSGTSNPVQVTLNPPSQCYCTSSATSTADEDIFNVSLGSLNNSSTCLTTGTGPGSVLNRYSNYTTGAGAPAAPVLLPGTTYPLSVQVGTCGGNFNNGTAVFIDYNQNGLFTDAGERVYGLATQTSGPHFETGNVTIPLTAVSGVTRMRVVTVEFQNGTAIAPCGIYTWGETEDYLVNIGVLTPCTGTPNPGNTITSATAVCSGSPITLSLQNNTLGSGVTYQWQSATSVGGPYTNIAGATSNTLTIPTLTATTFYQAIVTCAGNSGTSTPVQVTLNPPNQCYCTSNATSTADEDIFNVTVGTLNNSSTCATTAPGPGSLKNRYSNYTSYTGAPAAPDLVQGVNAPFSVQIGTCGGNFSNAVAIFIDLNQDGDFIDAGEKVYVSPATTVGPHVETGNLVIPVTATLGMTRMRVVNVETAPGNITPCGPYTWGETEDYNVNIVPCVPVAITGSPANTSASCGGNATFTVTTTGTVASYQWQFRVDTSSTWINVPNMPPYSGVNTATLTITGATAAMSGYQYRAAVTGACTGIDFSAPATLTVTPFVLAVTPASGVLCTTPGGTPILLTVPNPTITSTFTNTTPGVIFDDPAGTTTTSPAALAGITRTFNVSGITGSILSTRVTLNITHPYVSDLVASLKSANGATLNLDYFLSVTGAAGANFVNTVISSAVTTPALSGTAAPHTATHRADAQLAPTFGPTGPTGFPATVTTWAPLFATPNGTWTLGIYDGGPTDQGTFNNATLEIITGGAPATATFTPTAGLFTNAAGTIPYTGGPVTQVYAFPTVTTTYTATVSTATCTAASQQITVTVNTPPAGTPVLNSVATCVGTNATFNVSGITGGTALTYQLQVNSIAAPTVFTNVGTPSATPTFNVNGVTAAQNGLQYRVIVSAAGCTGPVTSAPATLTVNPTPVVTLSAAPRVNLFPGLTTTLTAAVSSATQPVTYQFFRNGVLVPGTSGNMITVGIDQLGTYTVKVTDANGCSSTAATSTPGSITIGDSTGVTTLFIYPSPNSGQFQVRYFNDVTNTSQTPSMVNVYDQKGARVFTRTYAVIGGFQAMNVDLGVHSRGIYRVELVSTNGERIKTGSVMVF